MRIAFFSNYLNQHQLPLSLEFNAAEGVEYTFVSLLATEGVVGRLNLDDDYAFVVKEYEGEGGARLAMRHAVEDEVVVFGDMAGKEKYVHARARTGKPFFRYAERILKRGDWWRFIPPKIYRTWRRFGRYRNSEMRVLCASAYTSRDLGLFGFPVSKCLKWGYFPKVEMQPVGTAVRTTLPRYKVLCSAQRLIPWKRVDLQIKALQRVVRIGADVELLIAGDGPERRKLEGLAVKLGVSDNVKFLGELSHAEVLTLMRKCGIFLATSDRNEGWGATINESMSVGCCVIASEEMGSVPFLIEDGNNGFVFHGEDEEELARIILNVSSDEDLASRVGEAAAETLDGVWSAREAAARFIKLSESIVSDGFDASLTDGSYLNGPLSFI